MEKTLDLIIKIEKPIKIKENNALDILNDFVKDEVDRFVSYGYKRENIEVNIENFSNRHLATINLYK